MNSIPPIDLAQQYQTIAAEVEPLVLALLASGRYIGGAAVADLEQQFAAYHGVAQAIACNSGTDALYLAFRALGLGPGDEVITSPFTFIATAETISAVGATPVFVDIEPNGYNLDLDAVAAAMTPRTKAIVPVHLFGQPVDMTRLQAIADRHHIPIIEDCAQATGATWGDRKVGSLGQIGCFSFYPTKNLGACGDGGMVITDDSALADEMRMLREHGSRQRYIHEAIGVNSRLDAIQATILQVKLRHLDAWNVGRTEAADRYAQCLSHNLRSLSPVQLPRAIAGGQATWNQYTLRIGDGKTPELRDRVRADLQAAGIGTAVYYPLPLHLQPVYAHLGYQPGQLPIAERTAHQVLSLPMFPELSPTQQEAIATALAHSLTQAAAPVGEGVR